MKMHLYPTLAMSGIKNNRQIYLPYIFSCIGSVMMSYIINYVSTAPAVKSIHGGATLVGILATGKFVIAVFTLIFLFYTNSFLIKRRNKEFGLYNILGMDKKGISRVIVWESIIVSAISIAGGLFLGIAFSKLAEMYLLYISHAEADFTFSISAESMFYTLIIFAIIFLFLLIKSVIQVHRTDPLELMKSENFGEKPPKANWVTAVIGAGLLIAAYIMAVTTNSPLDALFKFLIAVVMVIVATYLIFISGSVALCKILQKNKKYYYKKNHFVSISSMSYRMKRNGAGLASICILSTMVLVMMASSASLYFGADDSIKARFPEQTEITFNVEKIDHLREEYISQIRKDYEKVFEKNGVKPSRVVEYKYASIAGLLTDGTVNPDASQSINSIKIPANLRQIYFISCDEYNRIMGTDLKLENNEAMLYLNRGKYEKNTFEMNGVSLKIKGRLDEFPDFGDANVLAVSSLMLVVSDMDVIKPLEPLMDCTGYQMLSVNWYYGYDLNTTDDKAVEIIKQQQETLSNNEFIDSLNGYSYESSCLAEEKGDFFSTFGGLFFIGIMFSIMFIFAMAMIIYYKQISEGFEDQSRFRIMQNVGMTKKDIKKSINSQTLTVFFAPLILAGTHLAFAFPPIWKILQLFNLKNLTLVICVALAAFVLFGIFYAIIYKITARSYYSIVATGEKD